MTTSDDVKKTAIYQIALAKGEIKEEFNKIGLETSKQQVKDDRGWGEEIKFNKFYKKLEIGDIAIILTNTSAKVITQEKEFVDKKTNTEKNAKYFILNDVTFNIIINKNDECVADISYNVAWQFGKTIYIKLQYFFAKNTNESIYLLVYRKSQRETKIKKIESHEVDLCYKLKYEEIIKKYFNDLPVRREFKTS